MPPLRLWRSFFPTCTSYPDQFVKVHYCAPTHHPKGCRTSKVSLLCGLPRFARQATQQTDFRCSALSDKLFVPCALYFIDKRENEPIDYGYAKPHTLAWSRLSVVEISTWKGMVLRR